MKTYERALVVWVAMIVAESIHGVLRGIFLVPILGDLRARQIGVLVGSVLILLIAILSIKWINTVSFAQRIVIGMLWMLMTTGFEVVLGRAFLRIGWDRILSDYDVTHGGYMIFGLIVLVVSPVIALRLRNLGKSRPE